MSILIEQPDNIQVDSYAYFSPGLLEGFARTTNNPYDEQRILRVANIYESFSPLNSREASTLYHNFYGIQGINASIRSADGYEFYKLPDTLDYQTMKTPRSRAGGSVVDGELVRAVPAGITGYTFLNANLFSVTSDMRAVFSQDPPSDTGDVRGFRGFGMKLLEIRGLIKDSLYQSEVYFYFDIATYNYTEDNAPIPIGNQIKEAQEYYDSQTYIESGKNWPERAPTVSGKYTRGFHTLRDNNGNSVVFKTNLMIYRVQTKYYIYEPYSDPRLAIGVGAHPLPADPTIAVNGDGKFYSYRGNPVQPWHYGI